MKRTTSLFLLLSLSFCLMASRASGSSLREVELVDGSVLRAYILSMDGKTYRVRSDTLGEFDIPEYRVKAIRIPGASSSSSQAQNPGLSTVQTSPSPEPNDLAPLSPASSVPSAAIPSVGDLQQSFTQDPAAMDKILSLQNDPTMQAILQDDGLMQAIHSGNLGALLNDPKIRALMSHPTVRDLGSTYGR